MGSPEQTKTCLFALGRRRAEVRVAHYPLGTQNKGLYFGKAEVRVASTMTVVIGLRNLVTERGPSSKQ